MVYNPIGLAANLSSCNCIRRALTAFSSGREKEFKSARDWNDRTDALSRATEVYNFDDIKMGHMRRKRNTVKMYGRKGCSFKGFFNKIGTKPQIAKIERPLLKITTCPKR